MGRIVTGAILYLCIAFCLVACTRTIYIPVESVRTEYQDRYLKDSIYLHDSVYIRDRGDSIFVDRWHTRYIDRLRVDSFLRIDTIREPYPVEKVLSKWQQTKMDIGGWAIGAISGIFLLGIGYGIYKFIRINISIK